MTWPRQRSAWSAWTPALDNNERAVRRKSWTTHSLTPLASSIACLWRPYPPIASRPFFENTNSPFLSGNTDKENSDKGMTWSRLVLYLAAGIIQVRSPLSSAHLMCPASATTCRRQQDEAEQGPVHWIIGGSLPNCSKLI